MTQVTAQKEIAQVAVGDAILVDHQSDGQGKLVRTKETVDRVAMVYLDGTVCIGQGDVYAVEPNPRGGAAKWRTKMPKKDSREMRGL